MRKFAPTKISRYTVFYIILLKIKLDSGLVYLPENWTKGLVLPNEAYSQ